MHLIFSQKKMLSGSILLILSPRFKSLNCVGKGIFLIFNPLKKSCTFTYFEPRVVLVYPDFFFIVAL